MAKSDVSDFVDGLVFGTIAEIVVGTLATLVFVGWVSTVRR
jgi:hypothetical protein